MLSRLAAALLLVNPALPGPVGECGCWRAVRAGSTAETLETITAPATTTAWATGSRGSASVLLRWTGSRWHAERPNLPAGTLLTGVSATAADDAWTIGYTLDGVPRAAHRNARAWVPVPIPGRGLPRAISARTPSDAWAVGSSNGPGPLSAVAWHWDGRTWHQSGIPTDPGASSLLTTVAARSATDVWAAGTSGAFPPHPLVVHYDGRSWTPTAVPVPAGESSLTAVAAIAPDDVWLVGEHHAPDRGLALHWDGNGWSPIAVPSAVERLTSVAGDGQGGVWMTGNRPDGSAFFAHRPGTPKIPEAPETWTLQAAPGGPGTEIPALTRIPSTRYLWAAGTTSANTALTWTNTPRPR